MDFAHKYLFGQVENYNTIDTIRFDLSLLTFAVIKFVKIQQDTGSEGSP